LRVRIGAEEEGQQVVDERVLACPLWTVHEQRSLESSGRSGANGDGTRGGLAHAQKAGRDLRSDHRGSIGIDPR
jgi:hypothetical protein